MARRRRRTTRGDGGFVSELTGATLRLSHRVPLIGAVFAAACAVGWWLLRARPDAVFGAGRILAIALAVLAGFFALVAGVGLLRNLFPHADDPPAGRPRGGA